MNRSLTQSYETYDLQEICSVYRYAAVHTDAEREQVLTVSALAPTLDAKEFATSLAPGAKTSLFSMIRSKCSAHLSTTLM